MKLKLLIILSFLLAIQSHAHAGLKISCSMFPVYDFTREIAGSLAEVSLVMKPGTEPHEFEPSAGDVKALHDSDVFVFTGRMMEHWADRIADTLTDTLIIDASEGIALTDNDPHIWLDLECAQKMVMNICRGLCSADIVNAETYSRSAEAYCRKLAELDGEFAALPRTKALVFTGEFSAQYFVRRYGVGYVSAYEGENEPGIRRMAEVIRYIRDNGVRYVFADYGAVPQVTRSIAEQTGTEILTFCTAHNVPENTSFLQLMKDNLDSLKRFLND